MGFIFQDVPNIWTQSMDSTASPMAVLSAAGRDLCPKLSHPGLLDRWEPFSES